VSNRQTWARPIAAGYAGTVSPRGSTTVPVRISAGHLAVGRHRLTLVVQSENAEPNPTVVHVTVAVTR
jgi:hypothetical protein